MVLFDEELCLLVPIKPNKIIKSPNQHISKVFQTNLKVLLLYFDRTFTPSLKDIFWQFLDHLAKSGIFPTQQT